MMSKEPLTHGKCNSLTQNGMKGCVLTSPSLSRPDGEKKAYVRLAPDYDALDVANKVRPTSCKLIHIWIKYLIHPLINILCKW